MPLACRFRIVRLRWLTAALRLRCWVVSSGPLMACARVIEQRPPRHQIGTSFITAVATWLIVSWGFFFPMLLAKLSQEQVADTTENQMPLNGLILTDLKMIHAQLHFAVLEHAFDLPPAKGNPQQRLNPGRRCGVADEVFDLRGSRGLRVTSR